MTEMLPDRAIRRRALDPHESFIVQAPAGSGKTELLIQRFLTLLSRANQPEEIAALTFTRKAAAEMRDRVLGALEAAAGDPPEDPDRRFTWTLARSARDRNLQEKWQLEQHPARLRIQTIDALSAWIVRKRPIVSGLGSRVQVVEDAEELYREAARETLALLETSGPVADAVAILLRHLDNQLSRAETQLSQMLGKRDQWSSIAVYSETGLRPALEAVLRNIVSGAIRRAATSIPEHRLIEMTALARYASAKLGARAKALGACLSLSEPPGVEVEDLPCWLGLASLVLTAEKNEPRLQPMPGAGFTRNELSWQSRMMAVLTNLTPENFEALAALRPLPAPRYSDGQWAVIEALWQILPLASQTLQELCERRGQADFIAFAQAALEALGTPEVPTELAFSLDDRVRHLLVDEFQDTSQSQLTLLEKLTADWITGDGRTLFLVGDPMQSIFGFREADVRLFLQVRDRGLNHIRPVPLTLRSNFRSQPQLIAWANHAFSRIFPAQEDPLAGSVVFHDSVHAGLLTAGNAPFIHPLVDAGPEQEVQKVVELTRQALDEDEGSIAILLRARTHCPGLASALRAAGIPFDAVEFDSLAERGVIQDLLAITRALVQPADRISWLALLRAPWCGLTLDDLYRLAPSEETRLIPDLLADAERVARLTPEGRERLLQIRPVLLDALDQRRRKPLAQSVRALWDALGGPSCAAGPTGLEDAETFFLAVAELEEAGDLPDFSRLNRRVEKLFARPEAPGARVHLLTMHKAKGLEFDTVILAGLGQSGRQDDAELLSWLNHPEGIVFAPVSGVGDEDTCTLKYLQKVQKERNEQELRRLLYVAVTRARKTLHLIGAAQTQSKGAVAAQAGTMLRLLWPVIGIDYLMAAAPAAVPEPSRQSEGRPLHRTTLEWQRTRAGKLLPRPAPAAAVLDAISFTWTSETLRHIGTVVHRELRHLGRSGTIALHSRAPAWRAALANLGVPAGELDSAADRVRHALESTMKDERGRWILSPHPGVECELELTGWSGGVLRRGVIDRTFVENGIRWLIDFKTGSHEGGELEAFLDEEKRRYASQFETYATLLAARGPSPIRCGLYFPLLSAWLEWPASGGESASVAVSGGPSPDAGID